MLNNSLCKHCVHRASRVVSFEGMEVEFVDDDNFVDNTEGDSEELNSFTHEFCIMFCIELDHIVLDCSRFINITNK